MNGDDNDDALDWKDVTPSIEMLDSVTLGCIEMMRRKRVCFYPGPQVPPQPGEITGFVQCLPYLGECDALIFCAPHQGKQAAQARIQHCIYSGDFDHLIDRHGCVGTGHGEEWIQKDELLFPHKSDRLLVGRPDSNAAPQTERPPDSQFWAHYAILNVLGQNDKLHLLHLGLRGDHSNLYFLSPHAIRVARFIENPVVV